MKVIQVKISELKPAEYNPRAMPAEEMEKLKRSIAEFGFVEPVVVNTFEGRKNIIIGGHQRVEAARSLGMETVPAVYVSLDAEREKLLNLALNRIQGSWNEEKLGALLIDLTAHESVDLLLSGFNGAEVDDLLKAYRERREEDFNVEEAIKDIKTPQSREGEVYALGKHGLICGDSTDPAVVDALMAGDIADAVFTDPPYNVGYASRGKNRKEWKQAYGDDDFDEDAFEEFCVKAFGNFKRHLKQGGAYYICSGWSSWSAFWRALVKIGLKPRGCIIWDKGHGGMGWSDYWYQHEMVAAGFNVNIPEDNDEIYETLAYGFNDQAKHYFAKRGGARTSDVWRVARDAQQTYVHPTQKPLKLVENAIYNSTKPGERVLDLFGGSGSTLIAAERTGRVAYLVERSPLFCDVIRARYDKFRTKT